MTEFYGGWWRDQPDPRDLVCKITKRRGIDPTDIDLRRNGFMPPVYSQGTTNSCTAHAAAAAYQFMRKKAGKPAFMPSRLFIYYNERWLEDQDVMKRLEPAVTWNINHDHGAYNRDAMRVLRTYGCPPEMVFWPFDISKILIQPESSAYVAALTNKIVEYQRISDLKTLQNVLSHDIPIVFGMVAYQSFMKTSEDGIVPKPEGKKLGGHSMLLVGITDSYYIVRNSWGEGWGDSGYCYIYKDMFLNDSMIGDFWAIISI
jgi:C1A family cysteine protease